MKKSLKIASVALASLLAAGIFAGCGGDQKAASSKAAAADGKTTVKLVLSSTERPLSWADENGNLGPVYGHQWSDFNGVDQLKEVENEIRTNPFSRRLLISAW